MLTESGDEEESDNIITQVLDEIGIEISGKVNTNALFIIDIQYLPYFRWRMLRILNLVKLDKVPNPKALPMKKLKQHWQN